jgi:hypothetical protein
MIAKVKTTAHYHVEAKMVATETTAAIATMPFAMLPLAASFSRVVTRPIVAITVVPLS